MQRIELPTATFERLDDEVLRVRVGEGVEVDEALAVQYRSVIELLAQTPVGLLVDKTYAYSLTLGAQTGHLNRLPRVVASALLVHRTATWQAAQTQRLLLQTEHHPTEVFRSESEALDWLRSRVGQARSRAGSGLR